MNKEIELSRDIEDNPHTARFAGGRFMPYEPVSDITKEYSVPDCCIRTPRVPSMTIDDYIERLK
jgi:hypothetical protein